MILLAVLAAVCIAVAASPIGILARAPAPANLGGRSSAVSLTRAEYFDERRLLLEARQRGYQNIEQMVTGGATGALVFSITFLEKFVKTPAVNRPALLIWAWALLFGTLAAAMTSQYYSAKAFDCEVERLEAALNNEALPANIWNSLRTACSALEKALFLAGLAALACFAYLNAPFQIGG